MSNSSLINYTKISPNKNSPRADIIKKIAIHHTAGVLSVETIGNIFSGSSRSASANYGIGADGRIGMYVEEKNRSWCTSSQSNDNRAVTIEIASDTKHPYRITDKALQGFIDLSVDICKRNDKPKLLWKADKNLIGQIDKQNITVHRWFSKKDCPGEYIFNQLNYVADEVNKILLPKVNTKEFQVKINTASLNYRRGPGTNYPTLGIVRRNEVYTITEEAFGIGSSKWGKLKGSSGWIALDFCIRMG